MQSPLQEAAGLLLNEQQALWALSSQSHLSAGAGCTELLLAILTMPQRGGSKVLLWSGTEHFRRYQSRARQSQDGLPWINYFQTATKLNLHFSKGRKHVKGWNTGRMGHANGKGLHYFFSLPWGPKHYSLKYPTPCLSFMCRIRFYYNFCSHVEGEPSWTSGIGVGCCGGGGVEADLHPF